MSIPSNPTPFAQRKGFINFPIGSVGMQLDSIISSIEASRQGMIDDMVEMIRIPAIGPFNGGKGEGERADQVMKYLAGFDSVERVDVPDDCDPTVMRPNILARKNGRGKGTVWIVSHLDTVLPGDLSQWDSPPFEPRVDGDRIYGLGTEDNGQAVIASIYGARFFESGSLSKKSIGLAFVADEETKSLMGIGHLIDAGYFSEDDFILVPDWGVPGGTMVEVAEKHLLWVKVAVKGKQTHGSTPQKGINAFRVSVQLLSDLMFRLAVRYYEEDSLFRPPVSTFEPTKTVATVPSVNVIPAYHEFTMDCRILPRYDPDEVMGFIRKVAGEHAARSGADIDVEVEQVTFSGAPSATDTPEFAAFMDSVRAVVDGEVEVTGVGGGTCANFFRVKGMNAYVWECGGGTLHQPNEHVLISNMITDAKVYANLFYRLCV